LDLFHTLAFKGINIFAESDANLPTQLWISARYLHSISFLIFAVISRKKINSNLIVLFFVFIVLLIIDNQLSLTQLSNILLYKLNILSLLIKFVNLYIIYFFFVRAMKIDKIHKMLVIIR
jgi:hypothetical protein